MSEKKNLDPNVFYPADVLREWASEQMIDVKSVRSWLNEAYTSGTLVEGHEGFVQLVGRKPNGQPDLSTGRLKMNLDRTLEYIASMGEDALGEGATVYGEEGVPAKKAAAKAKKEEPTEEPEPTEEEVEEKAPKKATMRPPKKASGAKASKKDESSESPASDLDALLAEVSADQEARHETLVELVAASSAAVEALREEFQAESVRTRQALARLAYSLHIVAGEASGQDETIEAITTDALAPLLEEYEALGSEDAGNE